MQRLSHTKWSDYKSPLRVVVQGLLRSREAKTRKCRRLRQELADARRRLARQEAKLRRQEETIHELKRQTQRLQIEKHAPAQAACPALPEDPPVGEHGYGARMISLAVNLAKTVGLRRAQRALQVIFSWLNIQQKIPHFTTIRIWLQRVGLAALQEPVEPGEDWVWMLDHSNQIGPEKVLAVLGLRACQMPPPGTALRHEDVRVLAVRPGTRWKREDVEAVYAELAEQIGAPRAVLSDGAAELCEGVKCLKNKRSDTISLQDFKHKAANLFKALVGRGERFAEFNAQVGRTRSAIQQTELAHLAPLSLRQKARFMNLAPLLQWASTMLWLLDHPEAEARQWVSAQRLEEKLGWLRSFAEDLALWRECQEVLSRGVTWINQQGLFRGAAAQLRMALGSESTHPTSKKLADQLVAFVADAERQLQPAERLPMSTEILESSFGLYKQMEGQHAKGGFTSLLAGFAALLRTTTPQIVQAAFRRVSVQDIRQWTRSQLGNTLMSKRVATYQEYQQATHGATTPPSRTSTFSTA